MTDFQNEMNHAVQGFVVQIAELARRAALDTLESAFARRGGSGNGVGRPRAFRASKRTAEDLEVLAEKFASYVKSNPGLRIEQINQGLGTTTKDLALPIRKLIADGKVVTKGHKRSTKYFAGKRASKS